MELRKLDLRRLPGIDRGFGLALGPGVNLIQGPNGSGKSSVARAILSLLFPEAPADPRSDVGGSFVAGDRAFHVERVGAARATWRADDGGPLPALPSPRAAAAFRLGLLDLHKAAAEKDDQALAREIRSRMAGGYDVPRLLDDESFRLPARRLTPETEARDAMQEVERIRREFAAVAEDEGSLPDLEERLRRGAAAAAQRRLLDLADQLAQAQQRAATATARLAALPAILAHLRGDETARHHRLAGTLAEETATLAAATAAVARAQRDLDAAGPAPVPSSTSLAEVRARVDAAREQENLGHRAAEEVAAARRLVAERGRHLDPAWPADRRLACTLADLAAAEAVVRRLAGIDALAEAIAQQLARAGAELPPAAPDPAALREAMAHLAAWLAVATDDRATPRWPALVACGGLVAAALGWFVLGHGGWLAAAAGVVGLGLFAVVLTTWSRPEDRAARRGHAEAALHGTGVAPPSSWQREAVVLRLREVAAELAASQDAGHGRDRHAALLAEQTRLTAERVEAAAASHALASRCGLDPAATAVEMAELLRRVGEYHGALAQAEAAHGKQEAIAARLQEHLGTIGALLAPYSVDPPRDATAAAASLAELERRAQLHRDATTRLTGHRDALAGAQNRLAAAQAEWDDLFVALALPVGAVAELERLLNLAPPYQQAVAERDAAHLAVQGAEAAVASPDAAAVAALALLSAAQREAERSQLDALVTAAEAAREQKGRVLALADAARHGTRMQDALARLDGAQARWGRERDRYQERALARELLVAVAAEHQARSLPPVLTRATTLFARFTAGRYQLRVERTRDDAFVALDTASGRLLPLHELSDGTRAQLLLAARLAFVEDAERGEPLPLLLDDALTATDPERFAAVVGALLELVASRQRQILVFTANPATVAAWQAALAAAGLATAPVLDLAVVRAEAGLAPLANLAAPTRVVVPAPDGDDAASYARAIGVPPLDVHATAAAAHLFYLLADDLPALHRILGDGANTWGAAAALATALDRPLAGMTPAAWRQLTGRAAALDAFLAARRVGRGRVVDQAVLRGCERVNESTKAPEIEALLPQVKGRADRLLEALRSRQVQRVNARLVDELDAYLRAGGYLDDRPALSAADLLADVVAAVRPVLASEDLDLPELEALMLTWLRATPESHE